ncbi:uncharacterized protein LOC135840785 isoform X1 [Planococcus citri]|uniref:uncharacterized protein LOC135840785 isoform X1 n=1 Tax=Planococcus citri TaxID=170843 RepID=UPI0031F830E7
MVEDLNHVVYDILYPSPPDLTKIVSISIAVDLWCHEINTRRIAGTLDQLNLRRNILNGPMPRYLPISILLEIEKYVKRIGLSIEQWLLLHTGRDLFGNEILQHFADFVGDFDGSIHQVNTAKRLVLNDRIDNVLRLKMACTYCFEDDINRIWATISTYIRLRLRRSLFWSNPVLYYWICRLQNGAYRLPPPENPHRTIEEEIFCNLYIANWSFAEYFWSRFDANSRMRAMINSPIHFVKFYRYFLTNYNETELDEFVNRKALDVMYALLRKGTRREDALSKGGPYYVNGTVQDIRPYFRVIWNLIKHRMSEYVLFLLVRKILIRLRIVEEEFDTSNCCELWITAPDHLKRPVIQLILLDDFLCICDQFVFRAYNDSVFEFLFVVLSDASAEDRSIFWARYWYKMIHRITARQLNELMNFCLSNENEILEFKRNTLSVFQNLRLNLVRLLLELKFDDLNELLEFCCPDERLRENMLREQLIVYFHANTDTIVNISPRANDFIDQVFGDVGPAVAFKTQLLCSESAQETFKRFIFCKAYRGNFHQVIRFIEILAPSEQTVLELMKYCLFPAFEKLFHAGYYLLNFGNGEFLNFINASLSSEDEVAKFKKTFSIDEVVKKAILTATTRSEIERYNSFLVPFLQWYFVTPEALNQFKARYAENDVFVQLTTER